MSDITQKCATIALIGAPNAGKSTLLNTIIGQHLSIVTPKVQTTRRNIRGIGIYGDTELVWVDTPGIFKPKRPLERNIVKNAWAGVAQADSICLIVDATKEIDENIEVIIGHLQKHKIPACVALNKVDAIHKPLLLPKVQKLDTYGIFQHIFMISALKNQGLNDMINHYTKSAPLSPWLFCAEDLTDMPMRHIAEEVTRERLFLFLQNELPYSLTVETESWEECSDDSIKIHQTILVTKPSHKKIVIGDNASLIKRIGQSARRRISQFLDGQTVHLFLHVRVDPKWIERSAHQTT